MKKVFLLLMICCVITASAQEQTVSGVVTDAATGELLIGVSVSCEDASKGTISNVYGYFSLDIKMPCTLRFMYVGYEEQKIQIIQGTPLPLAISLSEKKQTLQEVVVHAKNKEDEISVSQTGFTHLDLKQIGTVPVLGGEKDIVKVLQLMPGIKRGSDGSTSMLVRGGSGDQNLVLVDEAPVYNASHLLGFFSVFNSDAIKDVTLQKGGFSSNVGGRLSSVLDIKTKDGNMKKMEVNGGIGLLSTRLSVEGPIIKGKLSFIVSARRTYVDQVYKMVGKNLPFYFYDVNGKINWRASDKDQFYLSAYNGKDVLKFGGDNEAASSKVYDADFSTTLVNATLSARWNHTYASQKMFQNVTLVHSRFAYELNNRINQNELLVQSYIQDIAIKINEDYYFNNSNHIKFGGELNNRYFRPNVSRVKGNFNESIRPSDGQHLSMREMAVYVMNEQTITHRFATNYGIRYSGALTGRTFYGNAEPRVNLSYKLTSSQTLKASYAHMSQYINLVTGSSTMPTDLWYPVSSNIKPQTSKQITLGYVKEWEKHHLLFSAETYYKWMNNLVEYKEGTVSLLNNNIEADLIQGSGKAYGVELLLHKKQGRWNGWLGYTLSFSNRQFDSLNGGETFYARYDRRHDLSVVANYEYSSRITFSAVWTFATGSRFTPVIGKYLMPNGSYTDVNALPIYSKRNAVVLSLSHRLDVNMVIKCKSHKRYSGEWHVGAYNLYNQTQPYRIRIDKNSDGSMKYNQVGLFGFIPSVAYNFKF
ncbi:MAG: TonB-dependent receptor [Bacteroidota bacterium]